MRLLAAAVVASLALSAVPVRAQDVISKESAAELKASVLGDLDTLRTKFVGLAQAFPQEKYTWTPMEGVRSVAEVLMLAAFDGKAANLGTREEAAKLRTLTDKTQIIDHLNKGFAHAKKELEALDASAMTGKRKVMGRDMSASQTALAIDGDLHEHLGQMIAYARMNKIVPPWSK
jgi:hypothetical protein